MTKNKLEITEEEILSDDGIFAPKYTTMYDNAEKCCFCGCAMLPGEVAMQLFSNGDVLHRSCWQEYADEYAETFGKEFEYEDDITDIG